MASGDPSTLVFGQQVLRPPDLKAFTDKLSKLKTSTNNNNNNTNNGVHRNGSSSSSSSGSSVGDTLKNNKVQGNQYAY